MAHLGKYTRSGTGHMCAHYERRKDENGKYVNFGNKEIDLKRTHLNYNLAPEHNQIDFIQKRLSEVKCLNRKDVNVMCDWVVTVPKDLPMTLHKEFFKSTYDFLAQKYGQKNVISAYVHMDETTPHMHFAFIPVAFDKKKGIEKVSAYKLFNKVALQKFHPELQAYLEKKLGVKCNVLNGATENGNRSIAELKAEKAVKDLDFYQKKANEMKEEYQSIRRDLNDIKNEYGLVEIHKDQAKRELESFSLEKESLQEEVDSLRKNKKALQNDNANLRSELISLGFQINKLKVEKEEYIKQKEKAALLTSQAVREVLQQAHEEFNKILETAAKHYVNDNIVKQVTEQVVERFEKKAPEETKKEVKAELQHEADEVVQCIRRRRGR